MFKTRPSIKPIRFNNKTNDVRINTCAKLILTDDGKSRDNLFDPSVGHARFRDA